MEVIRIRRPGLLKDTQSVVVKLVCEEALGYRFDYRYRGGGYGDGDKSVTDIFQRSCMAVEESKITPFYD